MSTVTDLQAEEIVRWVRSSYPKTTLTDDQIALLRVLTYWRPIYRLGQTGENRRDGGIRSCGNGIEVRFFPGLTLSTFDFNELTTIVLAAHKHRVRLSISGGKGDAGLVIMLHPRKPDGSNSERHPGLVDLIARAADFR